MEAEEQGGDLEDQHCLRDNIVSRPKWSQKKSNNVQEKYVSVVPGRAVDVSTYTSSSPVFIAFSVRRERAVEEYEDSTARDRGHGAAVWACGSLEFGWNRNSFYLLPVGRGS